MFKNKPLVGGYIALNNTFSLPAEYDVIKYTPHSKSSTIKEILFHEESGLVWDDFFKFGFVRNPWDRALSVYSNHYHIYCNDFQEFVNKIKVITSFINDNFTFELEEEFYVDYSRVVFNTLYNKDIDFSHKPWARDDVIFDPQFIPQYLFTHNEYDDQLVDTIASFENYAEDAALILERLGIDHPIEKIHASDHLPYRDVYTSEMVDIIADAYAKDIAMFGYEF